MENGYSLKLVEDVLVIALSGRIDSMNASDLTEEYKKYSANKQYSAVEIDCTNMEYISSAGLRILMIIKKDIKGGDILIKNASDSIKEIIEVTGFESIVTIC